MYGIYANIGGILMVNVTIYIHIYSIHGSYGLCWMCFFFRQKKTNDFFTAQEGCETTNYELAKISEQGRVYWCIPGIASGEPPIEKSILEQPMLIHIILLYYIILYYIILYYIILCYIILYYIISLYIYIL